jgi:carboxymethylenebutenolidase
MYESKDPIDELVHLYVDGAFNRRELFSRVARKTGGMAAAVAALSIYPEVQAAENPGVPDGVRMAESDPEIEVREVTFAGEASVLSGYLAVPKIAYSELQPGVMVIHENRGLTDHIKDVTRRAAKAGFVALSVDLLSRQGGIGQFPEPTQQTAAYNRTTQPERRADLLYALDYMKHLDMIVFDRIGVTGFCAGGGNVWDFIVNFPEVAAAVPFYGAAPALADVARIQTPVLAIHAERDFNLSQGILPIVDALSKARKPHGLLVYEGAGHGFHNDTGAAYNAEAAADAWAHTIAFFNKWLRRPRT